MESFRFREWKVYNDAHRLFSDVLKIVHTLPKEYRFELGSQMVRSSLSIVLNIAEGGGRSSMKELHRFLDIALGSGYETLAALDALKRNTLITEQEYKRISQKLEEICRQIGGFKKKVKT